MSDEAATEYFSMVKHKAPIFRLWEVPSFDPTISWTLYVDAPGIQPYRHPMIRKVTGAAFAAFPSEDYEQEVQAETAPSHMVKVQERHLKPEEFARLDIFRSFTFPPLISNEIGGVDGSRYGFQSCSYLASVHLEWWEDQPPEWHDLIDWAEDIRSYLDALLDNQEKSFRDINQYFAPDTPIWYRLT